MIDLKLLLGDELFAKTRERLIGLYKEHESAAKLAPILGVSSITVASYLQIFGIDRHPKGGCNNPKGNNGRSHPKDASVDSRTVMISEESQTVDMVQCKLNARISRQTCHTRQTKGRYGTGQYGKYEIPMECRDCTQGKKNIENNI